MKNEINFTDWKNQKEPIDVTPHFADNVMNQVVAYEQNKKKPLLNIQPLWEAMAARPFAKAGIITIAALTGLARVAFMIFVLLF